MEYLTCMSIKWAKWRKGEIEEQGASAWNKLTAFTAYSTEMAIQLGCPTNMMKCLRARISSLPEAVWVACNSIVTRLRIWYGWAVSIEQRIKVLGHQLLLLEQNSLLSSLQRPSTCVHDSHGKQTQPHTHDKRLRVDTVGAGGKIKFMVMLLMDATTIIHCGVYRSNSPNVYAI